VGHGGVVNAAVKLVSSFLTIRPVSRMTCGRATAKNFAFSPRKSRSSHHGQIYTGVAACGYVTWNHACSHGAAPPLCHAAQPCPGTLRRSTSGTLYGFH
jgi:hypothetical protein